MRVLLVSPLPPPSGGLATWTQQLIEYAPQLDLLIDVANTSLVGARMRLKNAHINIIDEIIRSVRIVAGIKSKLRVNKYDIVHINTICSPRGMMRDLICSFICRKVPIILQCHCNVKDWLGRSWISLALLRKLTARAEKILVLNQQSQKTIFDLTGRECDIVPNFLKCESTSKRTIIHKGIKRVVFVGRVRITKGIREILKVAILLSNIQFVIIGPIDDRVNELEKPDNVEFLGEKSSDEVADELSCSDVFLLPSYSEGFSVALLEAMYAGLPVIATDVGANADMLERHGGIIIPVKNHQAIVDAINQMQCAGLREEMGCFNRNKVENEYSIETVGRKLKRIYELVSVKNFSNM